MLRMPGKKSILSTPGLAALFTFFCCLLPVIADTQSRPADDLYNENVFFVQSTLVPSADGDQEAVIKATINALRQEEEKQTQADMTLLIYHRNIDTAPVTLQGSGVVLPARPAHVVETVRWAYQGEKIRYEEDYDKEKTDKSERGHSNQQSAFDGTDTYYYDPEKQIGEIATGKAFCFEAPGRLQPAVLAKFTRGDAHLDKYNAPSIAFELLPSRLTLTTHGGSKISAWLDGSKGQVKYEGRQKLGEIDCLVFEITGVNHEITRIWISAEHGYRAVRFADKGSIIELDSFQQYGGVWFPTGGKNLRGEFRNGYNENSKISEIEKWTLREFRPSAADSLFSVSPTPTNRLFPTSIFPTGTTVSDMREKQQ